MLTSSRSSSPHAGVLETLMHRVAGALLQAHSGGTVDSVPLALSMLAELFPVDQIWFWLAESPLDQRAPAGTHGPEPDGWLPGCWTWDRTPDSTLPKELWCMSEYPWAKAQLEGGRAIDRTQLDRMASDAPDELGRLHAHGVVNLLIVPVLHRSRLMGAIGLVHRDAASRTHDWGAREVSMLAIAGALLMRIVDRLRSHAAVERSAERYRSLSERLEQLVEERTRELRDLRAVQVELDKHTALGRMAATVAHEINNPLAGVVNALALVRDAVPPDDPRARYMGMIERETSRIANTVQQLFDLYRPGVPEPNQFELATAVADVVALLGLVAHERAVRIHTDVAPAVYVRLPESLVRQVLFNLVRNAIDASPNGGAVKVVAHVRGHTLHLDIADAGPGISPEVVERVFDPYYTTKQGETAAGLGLGLTITRDIITSLGGSIRFAERRARGAHAMVELPLPVLPEQGAGAVAPPGITTDTVGAA